MKKEFNLIYSSGDESKIITFGRPDSDEEMEKMYALRYNIYERYDYIDPERFPNQMDIDTFDEQGRCEYFIAMRDDEVIGSVRIIKGDILPTEEYFEFQAPEFMIGIQPSERFELSRLVVDGRKVRDVPRHIILLFLAHTVQVHAKEEGYIAAYAFIKSRLLEKLKKLKFPVNLIDKHTVHYPETGILHKYFNQKEDAVIPSFLTLDEVRDYIDKRVINGKMFKKVDGEILTYKIQNNVYTKFLRVLGIV